MTDIAKAPGLSPSRAEALARDFYNLDAHAEALPSERDQNFLLMRTDGRRFVLKIANPEEDRAILEMQNAAMLHLADREPGLAPVVLPNAGGDFISEVGVAGDEIAHGKARHFVRLVSFIEGVPLAKVRPHSAELLRDLGRAVARLTKGLEDFDHPAADRPFPWDLRGGRDVVRRHAHLIEAPSRRALVDYFLDWFERTAGSKLGRLRMGVIHNDANDWNVIVSRPAGEADSFGRRQVAGIVDFGDMVRSFTISDLAVACSYAMLDKDDPVAAAACAAAGYHALTPLDEDEMELLFPLIVLRLLLSVSLCAYQSRLRPGDDYLSISNGPVWTLLEKLRSIPDGFAHFALRNACGLAPVPRGGRIVECLRSRRGRFAPVMGYPLRDVSRAVFDLSVGSLLVGEPADAVDTAGLTAILFGEMARRGARVGIGRYDEPRIIYAVPQFKPAGRPLAEGRTVHLGIDVFVEAGEPVFAPLDGIVHSVQDNARPYDYGPTIILEHSLKPGEGGSDDGPCRFYTLYGHLSRTSVEGLEKGRSIRRGERLAAVGPNPENGGWPPHLHFQIMADVLGLEGDFPGVCRWSERDIWRAICPDANLILDIPDEELAPAHLSAGEVLEERRALVGKSFSLSYRRPLKIVRGFLQHLYDESGRTFLDAVNNVPHVGHSHPRVVEAVRRQIAVLNTNTRYLHDNLALYARRLTEKLPEPLRVCFFVNSGSEANDLALRMARNRTGRGDMIVIDGAYHGNLSSLIEISPYKFDGKGGKGRPEGTQVVPMPDLYQGSIRYGEAGAGVRYAAAVGEAVERIRREGQGPAGFMAESILSCGGQIVLPDGYLAEAYRQVRAAGGVCIADEVQVGFGRVGTHFWAFETQGVVPDIVTMGKPIGNGFPLAAVVTTREIADAFANGMEYFNTYGGNPVACAAGLAVLDVIKDEGLQKNALETGAYLKAGLEQLARNHPLIGDVRGLGLFLGIELVTDRETRGRATPQAAYLAERMREEGVLVSTDGPFRNVIKIKPPICFSRADADLFLSVLDGILPEIN